jgi:heme exporter protein D
MPVLIPLLGCWIYTVYRASGILERLAEQRRRDRDISMREEMRQRIPSK